MRNQNVLSRGGADHSSIQNSTNSQLGVLTNRIRLKLLYFDMLWIYCYKSCTTNLQQIQVVEFELVLYMFCRDFFARIPRYLIAGVTLFIVPC